MTKVGRKLAAFIALAAATVAIVSYHYMRVPQALGYGVYSVTLELPESGGLYENAVVRYRGVPVGIVDRLDPSLTGVEARLRIQDDTQIPADLTARVRSTSVIGEQYVDLVPEPAAEPSEFLVDGSVITADHADIPIPTVELMRNSNRLLSAMPIDDVRTVVDQLAVATSAGPETIGALLDNAMELERGLGDNLDPLMLLLNDLQTVLATQVSVSPDLNDSLGNLDEATGALVATDSEVRQILDEAAPALQTTARFLGDSEEDLAAISADAATLSRLVGFYSPAIEHILTIYPAMTSAALSIVPEDRLNDPVPEVNVAFKMNLNSPAPCYDGFPEADTPRSPHDLSPRPPSLAYCQLPHDDPRAARGVRNIPCLSDPSVLSATARECGQIFTRTKKRGRQLAATTREPFIDLIAAIALREPAPTSLDAADPFAVRIDRRSKK